MRAAIIENAASRVRKAGFYPCNNTFRPYESEVAETDCERASVETPKEPQPGTSSDQVNNTPNRAIENFPLPVYSEKSQD
jgi:hypothetical protein